MIFLFMAAIVLTAIALAIVIRIVQAIFDIDALDKWRTSGPKEPWEPQRMPFSESSEDVSPPSETWRE